MKRTLLAVLTALVLAAALATTAVAVGPRHGGAVTEAEYLVEMVAHHEEAIDAAGELSRSNRAAMRDLGTRIVASQTAQVEQMRQLLAQWHPDEPTVTDYHPMMRDLSQLSGARLDRAFLVDMIPHHMMAVMTSRHLLASGAELHPEVEALAEQIIDEQSAEIIQMRRWLRTWFGAGGRGPCPMMGRA